MANSTTEAKGKEAPSQKRPDRLYRGQTLQYRRTERREKLMAAGLELFGTHGYNAVTIEQICSYSRVTARYFYEEFKTREELLTAVFERAAAELSSEALKALNDAPDSIEGKTRRVIEAIFRFMLDDPRRARVVVLEAVGAGAPFWNHVVNTKGFFVQLLESEAQSLVEAGVLRQRDYNLAASAVYGAGRELLVEWILREEKPSFEDMVEELVGVVLAIAGMSFASDAKTQLQGTGGT